MDFKLSDIEKATLLKIARQTIYDHLFSKKVSLLENINIVLDRVNGVFVTLTLNGSLRGCIGNIIGQYPLFLGVQKMAIQSAFYDSRFSPLSQEEFAGIKIEISVLSPLIEIQQNDIVIGKHGLLIKHKYNSGVFLPQVPVEQGWNKKQYLENLCRKAGIEENCYQDKECTLFGFTALVFSEEKD